MTSDMMEDEAWNQFCCFTYNRHVCTRARAEHYDTEINQAFICQERYTTACGQLDWRRCTKYRVNTCYTPKQKTAIRYNTVEQCCPGWLDDGGGRCIVRKLMLSEILLLIL